MHFFRFFFSQTRRKFQYFAIQDSSIIIGLLEESLKAKGKLLSYIVIILVESPGLFEQKVSPKRCVFLSGFLFIRMANSIFVHVVM